MLSDPRFKDLFENPEFEVDEESREYALLNPSAVAQRLAQGAAGAKKGRTKTAVEEEEEESDKPSSDGFSDDESESGSEDENDESASEDSDAAGGQFTSQPLYVRCVD